MQLEIGHRLETISKKGTMPATAILGNFERTDTGVPGFVVICLR